jgi:hypothetical protein
MDFMLARIGSVPPGSTLVFTYGPTTAVYVSWALASVTLAAMLIWLARPRSFRRLSAGGRVAARFKWNEDEG